MGTLKLIDNFQMYNLNKAEKATLAQTYKALVEEGTTSSTPDQPSVQSGEEGYQNMLIWTSNNSSNMRAWIDFKPELSDEIYKGADMFLMPSLFEPCGISQMIAMKYGTIPIVRATGGLDDTIISYPNEKANGFKFLTYDAKSMVDEIKNGIWTYYDRKDDFKLLIKNAYNSRFTWTDSAKKYVEMYREMLKK